jgi:hypothetical protein
MPASLPALPRAVARRLLELAPRRVFTTLELLPTEFRDLLFLLPPTTEIHAADLDLSDPVACGGKLRALFSPEWAGAPGLTLGEAQTLLTEQEQGRYQSADFWAWVGGLGGAVPGAELSPPRPPPPLPDPGGRLPLLVLGRGTLVTDLHQFLEASGAFVVHDEEPAAELLASLSSPEEFARRLFWRARLEAALEAGGRGQARGALFVHEAFSGRSVEEALYRGQWGGPFLSLPVEELGPLDGRQRLRVGAFLELLRGLEVGP